MSNFPCDTVLPTRSMADSRTYPTPQKSSRFSCMLSSIRSPFYSLTSLTFSNCAFLNSYDARGPGDSSTTCTPTQTIISWSRPKIARKSKKRSRRNGKLLTKGSTPGTEKVAVFCHLTARGQLLSPPGDRWSRREGGPLSVGEIWKINRRAGCFLQSWKFDKIGRF